MEKNLEKTKVMPRIVPSLKREPKDYNPRLKDLKTPKAELTRPHAGFDHPKNFY